MAKITDTLTRWLVPPTPFEPPAAEYTPPALSEAALTVPTSVVTAAPRRTDDSPNTMPGAEHTQLAHRAPLPTNWAPRAWQYYKWCGEARQSVDWIANGISRFQLYIGKRSDDGSGDPEPVKDPGAAGDVLTELCEAMGMQALLHRLATHLLVPGESWLVGYPPPGDDDKEESEQGRTAWTVLSRAEWQDGDSGRLRIKLPEDPRATQDHWVTFPPEQVAVVPIYKPDAEDASYATSAFQAALSALDELDGLDRRVGADINSRLAGAGVFAVPESSTMPTPMQSEGVNPLHGDGFIASLTKAMSTAIQNPDSASAVTPIVIKVADETLAKLQHITFSTPFDAQIPPLREGSRERVAADMDVPAEVVTGIKELSHWSAWQVSEDAARSHMGPLAALICNTITKKILQPALTSTDADSDLVVWFDMTEVVLRTDRSTETLAAHKQGLINGEAARRELGFSEDDAPGAGDEPESPAAGDDTTSPDDEPDTSGGQATPSQRPNPPRREDSTTQRRIPPGV